MVASKEARVLSRPWSWLGTFEVTNTSSRFRPAVFSAWPTPASLL